MGPGRTRHLTIVLRPFQLRYSRLRPLTLKRLHHSPFPLPDYHDNSSFVLHRSALPSSYFDNNGSAESVVIQEILSQLLAHLISDKDSL